MSCYPVSSPTNRPNKNIATPFALRWFFALVTITLSFLASAKTVEPLPLSELRTFSEVYAHIKANYVAPVDDHTLIKAAVAGMVSQLDKHSRLMQAAEFSDFSAGNEGEYAGIGLAFEDHPNGLRITHIIENGPADKQALKSGLVITHINQIEIKHIQADDAFKLINGEVGSQLVLTFYDPKLIPRHEKVVRLTRELINLPTVRFEQLPGQIAYIAIDQFSKKTPFEFIDQMEKHSLPSQLIIDLRDNPGGVLDASIQLADLFVEKGTIIRSVGRAADANEIFNASAISPYSNTQVAVLMNAGSASASEIFAVALRDHDKATIFGEKSYGKGTIQSIFFLENGSGLKMTTAEYFSPKGKKIQDIGVSPDIKSDTENLSNATDNPVLNDLGILQAYQWLIKR